MTNDECRMTNGRGSEANDEDSRGAKDEAAGGRRGLGLGEAGGIDGDGDGGRAEGAGNVQDAAEERLHGHEDAMADGWAAGAEAEIRVRRDAGTVICYPMIARKLLLLRGAGSC